MSSQQSPAALQSTVDREKVYTWIIELSNSETRENALLELSKKREVVPDLAPMLWHSFGTTASLLQEIINIYPAINPATLTAYQSNRVCNALALLQCVASHPETRSAFLQVRSCNNLKIFTLFLNIYITKYKSYMKIFHECMYQYFLFGTES